MKRFAAYCLIVVTLFIGVASTSMVSNTSFSHVANSPAHEQSSSNDHQSFFTANELPFSVGMNTEQIRLSHSIQNFSHRVLPSLLNAFRIQHSSKIDLQKYFTIHSVFLLNSANKQMDGYYLYHLRKLLI